MAALPVPVLAPAVFPTPDLHDFKYSDLFKATEDEISAIAWCQNNGLIAKDKMCASCGSPTALRERDTVKNKGFYFRCTLRSCRKEISVRKDTWFEGSHLRIATIIQFVYFWCRDYVIQDELQFQLGIVGEHTIVDWKNFCRDICLEYFIRNPVVIGGPGQTVEIDECMFVSAQEVQRRTSSERAMGFWRIRRRNESRIHGSSRSQRCSNSTSYHTKVHRTWNYYNLGPLGGIQHNRDTRIPASHR